MNGFVFLWFVYETEGGLSCVQKNASFLFVWDTRMRIQEYDRRKTRSWKKIAAFGFRQVKDVRNLSMTIESTFCEFFYKILETVLRRVYKILETFPNDSVISCFSKAYRHCTDTNWKNSCLWSVFGNCRNVYPNPRNRFSCYSRVTPSIKWECRSMQWFSVSKLWSLWMVSSKIPRERKTSRKKL